MLGVKSIRILILIFSFYQKMSLHPFRQTSGFGKWVLHEEYGGPSFGEKIFQLF